MTDTAAVADDHDAKRAAGHTARMLEAIIKDQQKIAAGHLQRNMLLRLFTPLAGRLSADQQTLTYNEQLLFGHVGKSYEQSHAEAWARATAAQNDMVQAIKDQCAAAGITPSKIALEVKHMGPTSADLPKQATVALEAYVTIPRVPMPTAPTAPWGARKA